MLEKALGDGDRLLDRGLLKLGPVRRDEQSFRMPVSDILCQPLFTPGYPLRQIRRGSDIFIHIPLRSLPCLSMISSSSNDDAFFSSIFRGTPFLTLEK